MKELQEKLDKARNIHNSYAKHFFELLEGLRLIYHIDLLYQTQDGDNVIYIFDINTHITLFNVFSGRVTDYITEIKVLN